MFNWKQVVFCDNAYNEFEDKSQLKLISNFYQLFYKLEFRKILVKLKLSLLNS